MSQVEFALALAARGWFVFPVVDKAPVTFRGHLDAVTDPEQIRAWWEHWAHADPAIDLERSGLVVLDVDVKPSKAHPEGAPGLRTLETLLPVLPETMAADTPSGGVHLYYDRPAGWKPRRAIGWGPGLDLLSKGYVVAYPTDDAQVVQAPDALQVQRLGGSQLAQERSERSRGTAATPEVLKAAQRWLRAHGGAVEGEGGNGHTVQAVTRLLWDYDLTPEEAWPLLEEWNRGCEPPWDEEELAYKVEHLHEGDGVRGVARLAVAAKPKREPAGGDGSGDLVEDLIPLILADAKLPTAATPWPTLDAALGGGLGVGTLTVVTAGTGRGKTSFAVQLGAHHAKERPCVYYMGELSPQKLAARLVAQRRRLPWSDVLHGRVTEAEMRRVLHGLDLRIIARCEEPAEAITTALDRAAERGGPVMLVVDYAQLLTDLDDKDTRIATTRVVRWLLQQTVERGLVTVVLSQTSRFNAAHLRADHEMKAEDAVGSAAESSAFEQDADNVLTLRVRNDEGDAELLVGKARLRGPGKVGMKFHGASGWWEEQKLESAVDRGARTIEEALRTLNDSGVYPSKDALRRECGITSKRAFAASLGLLGDRVEIIGRDPEHHTSLKYPGLMLTSPKERGGG